MSILGFQKTHTMKGDSTSRRVSSISGNDRVSHPQMTTVPSPHIDVRDEARMFNAKAYDSASEVKDEK